MIFGYVDAQIADVKIEGNRAKVYNENAKFTGYFVNLCAKCELSGYNNKYIVVTNGNRAKIYDSKGRFTGYFVNLHSGAYVKNVTASAILIVEGGRTKFYDFKGRYTGKSS